MPKIQENSVFNFSSPISYNGLQLQEVGDCENENYRQI
jgi:hypothetical protein